MLNALRETHAAHAAIEQATSTLRAAFASADHPGAPKHDGETSSTGAHRSESHTSTQEEGS